MRFVKLCLFFSLAAFLGDNPVSAAPPSLVGGVTAGATPATPDAIDIYFEARSARIRPEYLVQLDHAARLYRDGQPILMTVAGGTDGTGSPQANIRLSQKRADAVFNGLVARGIPASRFQILAKGSTDPAIPGDPTDAHNRRAEITWK